MSNAMCKTLHSGDKWKNRGLLLLSFLIPGGIYALSMLHYKNIKPFQEKEVT